MRRSRTRGLGPLAVMMFWFTAIGAGGFTADPVRAEQFYVTVTGATQGKFKGESLRRGTEDKLEALKFSYEVVSPRDPATGQATGKRAHKPFVITKVMGAASPQLFMALTTKEVLPAVQLEVIGVNAATGAEQLLRSIKLVNALVVDDRLFSDTVQNQVRAMEEVAFTFQRIEIIDVNGKTTAVDDVMSP